MENQYKGIIEEFKNKKILVIGDAILDTYVKGFSERLSREAPVPIINVSEQIHECGGAANTAINVSALGAATFFLTVIGKDPNGKEIVQVLKRNKVNTEYIIKDSQRITLAKKRVTASSNILLRIDEGSTEDINIETEKELIKNIKLLYSKVDAIILSDYGYGILTEKVIKTLETLKAKEDKIIIADSKNLKKFRTLNPLAVKPNYEEAINLLNLPKIQSSERINQILGNGKKLLEFTGAQIVIATMDLDGSILFEKGKKPYTFSTTPQDNKNAIGAGDTFVSTLTLCLCSDNSAEKSVEMACAAAAIVLRKEGTGVCNHNDLQSYYNENPKYILQLSELAAKIKVLKKEGKKIVFSNGCFDILHKGHVELLNRARSFGDVLIIGINSDASIKKLKGNNRPINSLNDRITVLSGLQSVDFIIPFEENSPLNIINAIQPDIFVKGGDYKSKVIPEASLVKHLGGEVKLINLIKDKSTTNIINKIIDTSNISVKKAKGNNNAEKSKLAGS